MHMPLSFYFGGGNRYIMRLQHTHDNSLTSAVVVGVWFVCMATCCIPYVYCLCNFLLVRLLSACLQYVDLLVVLLQIMVTFSKLYIIATQRLSLFVRGDRAALTKLTPTPYEKAQTSRLRKRYMQAALN